jgi:alkylation response protein AidB-like acyl-CoA dehydrogenase
VQFGFDDNQVAFRDATRTLLAEASPPSAVRAAWSVDGPGLDRDVWKQLGEMGVLGMLAPSEMGGLGLGEVDQVLLLEETGRAALPGPVVEHAAVAVPLLAGAGRTSLLEAAVSGSAVVTVAPGLERVGWAKESDALVALGPDEVRLVRADQVAQVESLDVVDRSRRDGRVEIAGFEVIVGADVALARDRAALGVAAQLCGLASRLVEMTADYARERRQFDVPIGSFQAIKHHLANAALRLEHARPAVYRAAYSVMHDLPSRGRDVSMAKVMAGQAGAVAARVALQCHGAIGYTWESDLHLWLKRVWVLERAWGSGAEHRARVADAVLGPNVRPAQS